MRWQLGLAAMAAAGVLVPAAEAQAPPPAKSVTTIGAASARVKPKDRKSNASIRDAVEAADAAARPKAVANAREHAAELAQAAGLTLGAITSVSDAPSVPFYGPYGVPYSLQGTFGPGKYCGITRSFHLRRDSQGRVHRVAGRRHRVCRIPPTVTVSLTIAFAAT
jgi:hypothetical protein